MVGDGTPIEPQTILDDRYCLERKIGSGGMGDVYEATHLSLGRKVAIKTLRIDRVLSDSSIARFKQEARLAGSIGHENICEATDFGTHGSNLPYIVMPLLKGRTLSCLLGEGSLPISRIVHIVIQALSALAAAHEARIVHRDLKPSNIFITESNEQRDFVKLLDFGVSKVLDMGANPGLTETGSTLGTPYYMSPEQAAGVSGIDHRIDIYASGVVLYEALTGRLPFEGGSRNAVLHKIITDTFLPPRRHNSSIPPALESVVLRAMARDPAKRFESAGKMRRALEKIEIDASLESISDDQDVTESHVSVLAAGRYILGDSSASRQGVEQGRSLTRKLFLGLGIVAFISSFSIGVVWLTPGTDREDEKEIGEYANSSEVSTPIRHTAPGLESIIQSAAAPAIETAVSTFDGVRTMNEKPSATPEEEHAPPRKHLKKRRTRSRKKEKTTPEKREAPEIIGRHGAKIYAEFGD